MKTDKNSNIGETPKETDERFQNAVANFKNKDVPQPKPKKKSHIWLNLIVLVVSIAIGVYLVVGMSDDLGSSSSSTFVDAFSSVSAPNAVAAIVVLLAILLLDMSKFFIIIHATTKEFRPLVSAKVSLWGRYYDNITPSSTGGQPMQILYLHGKDMSGGRATAIVVIKYFVNTFSWVIIGCIVMATNVTVLDQTSNGSLLKIAGWIGWSVNMLLPFVILSFVAVPKLATKITRGIVSLGAKLRIVKDKEKTIQKAIGVVQDFRSSFIIISKRPFHLILLIIVCVADMAVSFGFPYFIIKMFNGYTASQENFSTFYSVMGLNAYAIFGSAWSPTPGASGVIEGLLAVAFSGATRDNLVWVTLTYRFATYYIYILIGLGITIFNFARSIMRSRKEGKAPLDSVATEQNAEIMDKEVPQTNASAENSVGEDNSPKRVVVEFSEKDGDDTSQE